MKISININTINININTNSNNDNDSNDLNKLLQALDTISNNGDKKETTTPTTSSTATETVEVEETKKTTVGIAKPNKSKQVESSTEIREKLELQAKELGIKFRSDISDKSLAIKIKNHKPKKDDNTSKDIQDALADDSSFETDMNDLKKKIAESSVNEEKNSKEDTSKDSRSKEEIKEEEVKEIEQTDSDSDSGESEDSEETDDNLKLALKSRRGSSAIQNRLKRVSKVDWGS